jgi:hypothetical protein
MGYLKAPNIENNSVAVGSEEFKDSIQANSNQTKPSLLSDLNVDSFNTIDEMIRNILPTILPNNKFNRITIKNNTVIKSGPSSTLCGEIFFYKNIPTQSFISSYFPKFISSIEGSDNSQLVIEEIESIPFYTLFKHQLISESHIMMLFEFLDTLHSLDGDIPTVDDMYSGYIDKLKKRFEVIENYPYPDANDIQKKCLINLENYIPYGVAFIHGDLWFSNILLDYKNNMKVIDMRGQLNNKLTTGGDRMYDYGKLYQSILGYDAALYGDTIPHEYTQKIKNIFIREIEKRNISLKDLRNITISLMIGTFHAIEKETDKLNVWNFIKGVMNT